MQEFMQGPIGQMLVFFVPMGLLFYFMILRPQQKQIKAHADMVAGMKLGDTVVLSSGMVGKVTRVENDEVMVEVAQGMNVRVIKKMIPEVRNRTATAANDAKA